MMKRLVNDALSTHPLSITFYLLGGSGQIQGHRLSRARMAKIAASGLRLTIAFGWGFYVGWLIWAR